jgi:2-polyprenyl-3-methyl-5-hydroxy-6-metoxy-1,4-benzoquinol methylase
MSEHEPAATDPRAALARAGTRPRSPAPRRARLVRAHGGSVSALPATRARIPEATRAGLAEIAVFLDGDEPTPPPLPEWPNLRVHRNPRRYGHGGRRKVALEYALAQDFDHAALIEADGRHPVERLAELLAPVLQDTADVVVGGSDRAPGSRLLRTALGMDVRDWASGMRVYASRVLRRIPFQLAADGRRFDTEILIQCRALGARVRGIGLGSFADPGFSGADALAAALDYRLHQLHVQRNGAFLVDRDIHYTFKNSPAGSHVQILRAIPPGARVLDLGCSQGLLARPLRDKGVRTTGVDVGPPERVSKDLESYHRRDLEEPLELPEGREFDYVVIADVIEHLRNREQLLRSARRHLKPEGRLLISTPNIAIWFYRLSLLVGRFEYGPRGVLDETHVHLFTQSTFRREVERGGFRILRQRVTSLPFEVAFESTGQSRLVAALSAGYHLVARIYPKLFAYQFLLEAEVTTLLDTAASTAESPAARRP